MTLQRAAAIEETLYAVLKLETPWGAAAKRIGAGTTGADVKDRLDAFVARRNLIAHSGDVQPGKAALAGITREWVMSGVRNVSAIGEAACDAVAKEYGPKRGKPKEKG